MKKYFDETEIAQHKNAINQMQEKFVKSGLSEIGDAPFQVEAAIAVNKNMLEYLAEILKTKKYESLKNPVKSEESKLTDEDRATIKA